MSVVQNLEVFADDSGESLMISTTSLRYQIVDEIINFGIQILESLQGRDSLVQIATAVIQERNNPPGKRKPAAHIYNRDLSEMPQWVDFFLGRLRSNFPQVYLIDTNL
ncbi:hypothetical protein GGR53DRAFT_470996 [Hypoxylon sp. FL1150]|nr:hypothetical protein GGR53DRAFT_470996 [Hypoxylon sp. FL1150]